MKRKFLKIEKTCQEEWKNMSPTEQGSFCKLCSKNVIDFTKLSQLEISKELKKANGNLCARLTKEQLNMPLIELNNQKKYRLPYSNVAASLIIASTLSTSQLTQANTTKVSTEFVVNVDYNKETKKNSKKQKPEETKPSGFTYFKGIVKAEEDGELIENAKITFFTTNKLIETYTYKNGAFLLKIPTELIDNDNVIRVTYDEIKNTEEGKERFYGYESIDYVLSKKEINSDYQIKAVPIQLILGGIGHYSEDRNPIVLSNGREIEYKTFSKAQQGFKSSCDLNNKDFYFFNSIAAIAIYGEKAKYGLYILIDKVY